MEDIRSQMQPDPCILSISPVNSASFSQFQPIKMCPLDTIPTKLLKEAFSTVSPVILHIFNKSLASGSSPDSFKQAIVNPLLKKLSWTPCL